MIINDIFILKAQSHVLFKLNMSGEVRGVAPNATAIKCRFTTILSVDGVEVHREVVDLDEGIRVYNLERKLYNISEGNHTFSIEILGSGAFDAEFDTTGHSDGFNYGVESYLLVDGVRDDREVISVEIGDVIKDQTIYNEMTENVILNQQSFTTINATENISNGFTEL